MGNTNIYDENEFESFIMYKFQDEKPYTITKDGDVWVIKGAEIEKLFKMTKFTEDEYNFTDKNAIKVMAVLNNIAYSFFRITASFLQEKEPIVTKIKFKKDPIEILGKISPLISKKEFNNLINNNLKGKKAK